MSLLVFCPDRCALPVHFDSDSFVSHRLGFVYQCIPKTLSRSMLAYLSRVDPDGYRAYERHVGSEVLLGEPGAAPPRTFTFVRNPYSRVVAVYYDKFVNYRGTPGQRALFDRYTDLHHDLSFSEFAEWLASPAGSDRQADPHFLSQHYFVLDAAGEPAIELVGRVENVEADMPEIQRRIGLAPEALPWLNSNSMGLHVRFDTATQWREILDDRSLRLITSRYDGDFELLGYERLPFRIVPEFVRGGTGTPKRATKPSLGARVAARLNRLLGRFGLWVVRAPRRQASKSA